EKYEVNSVLSLQNVTIPQVEVPQRLYIQQSLPFVNKRYKVTENPKFWVYQNIIGKKMYKSIKKADEVIVQTQWMKKACIEKTGADPKRITVVAPKLNIKVNQMFRATEKSLRTFFYPANG